MEYLKTNGGNISGATTATLTVTPTGGSVLSRFITSGTLTAQFTKWKLTSLQGELNLVPPPLLSLLCRQQTTRARLSPPQRPPPRRRKRGGKERRPP